jgi:hypothetical protein
MGYTIAALDTVSDGIPMIANETKETLKRLKSRAVALFVAHRLPRFAKAKAAPPAAKAKLGGGRQKVRATPTRFAEGTHRFGGDFGRNACRRLTSVNPIGH